MCAQRTPEQAKTTWQKAIIPGAFHGTLHSSVTTTESMRIALFRTRATRGGPLPIDRIPVCVHGVEQTFQNEDRLAGQVLKRKVKGWTGGKSLEKKMLE